MSKTKCLATTGVALLTVLLCFSIDGAAAQENAQLQIPPSLVECYNTSFFMNRDNRLPSTIGTLITLIEKIENSYLFSQDIRQLSISLLHRFRQDGIQRAPNVVASSDVIPYSPTGFQFPKFRILLSRLIPGNALSFPNDTLSREERCSLHFMLSSSFDTRVRGDEGQVCNQLSNYRAQRIKRSEEKPQFNNNFMGDVEILEEIQKIKKNRGSSPTSRQVYGWNENDYGTTNINDMSTCPVENGVVWTPYGNIAAGTVIAGIAAGLAPQTVQLRTLLALSSRPGVQNAPQLATVTVDNRWASTLAGDLAEVALVQVPMSPTDSASVGASGAWNSSVIPKWYFLTQRQNLEMTDAEIRGGLDGLILAMNIANWRTQASSLKLSQLLRMYYSSTGVLSSGIMACNRKDNFPNIAPINTLISQTSAFAQVLDREMRLRVTLSPTAIANFSSAASVALQSYVPGYLNDPSCPSLTDSTSQDISSQITPMTNIYVFLDTSWQYLTVSPYLMYVLQRLNINPYASQVTLLAGNDGSIIVNTTNYLSDVEQGWNVTTHGLYTPGFNLPTVLKTVQNLTQTYMAAQKVNNSVGGYSVVALLMPYMTTFSDSDSSYATTQLQYIYEQMPDLNFIYYAGGTINRFNSFVRDPTQDLYSLSVGQTVVASSSPVLTRIVKIPRQLINPLCGAYWYSNSWGSYSMTQYAAPGTTNFYKLLPNYFFPKGNNRLVTINAQYSQFTICTSRTTILPTQNNSSYSTSSNDIVCQQVQGSTFSYDLSNACNGYKTINQCPPLYLSVAAPSSSSSSTNSGSSYQTVSCTNAACQTPNQVSYVVTVVNLDCNSSAVSILTSCTTILMALLLLELFK